MSRFAGWMFIGVVFVVVLAISLSSFNLSAAPPGGVITVISPNGGESWALGSTCTITWTATDITSGQFRIFLFDGDTSLGTIAMYLPASQESFTWIVGHLIDAPDVGAGSNYRIKIRVMSETPKDFSDAPFSITSSAPPPSGSIRIISPNGEEVWPLGSSRDITWSAPGINSGTYRVSLLKGGSPVGILVSGLPATQHAYNWNVGTTDSPFPGAGSNYRIQVEHLGGTALDFSDNPFVISTDSSASPPVVRRDGVGGEAAFVDLVLNRVYISGNKLAVGVANLGNRHFDAPRVPFSVWINQESGPPAIRLRRRLTVPAGGATALQLIPINPQWCPTCCGVPISVAVNRGEGALPELNTRNNSKLERIFLKRRDWRLVPLIMLGASGGSGRIINSRTEDVLITQADGRVRGAWGQGAAIAMNATFRVKNCGYFGSSSYDPSTADGFEVARLTIQVYQKGVWETVQVRGNDGVTRRQTRFNPNKLRFAGGKGFQADIPIGRDAPLVLPVTLVHPGTEASRLIFLFKDYRPGDWGVLGIIGTSDAHTFNMQRMEFSLEFR